MERKSGNAGNIRKEVSKVPVSYIQIDLKAIRHNLQSIRRHIPEPIGCMAVIKADAYGHGAAEVLQVALQEGYNSAAVARVQEGVYLRGKGFACPIYVLGDAIFEEVDLAVSNELIVPLDAISELPALEDAAVRMQKTANVMLAVDTGMNRIGVHIDDIPALLKALSRYPHVHIHGLFTHLATADEPDKTQTEVQLALFDKAVSLVKAVFGTLVISAANSAGVMDIPASWYNTTRPGVIIFGSRPSDTIVHKLDLLPALSLVSHITHVQQLRKGEALGYGATFVAPCDMWTATIPVGYADGFPRCLSNRGFVLAGGKKRKIIGRICMDQLMIEGGPELQQGDEAILIGKQEDERITIEDVAEAADTIPHEIMCGLKRIPRVFTDE